MDLQVNIDGLIPIFCDNTSAINISKNRVQHSHTIHISIRFHFRKERVADGDVCLDYVNPTEQLADIFSKPLQRLHLRVFDKSLELWLCHAEFVHSGMNSGGVLTGFILYTLSPCH